MVLKQDAGLGLSTPPGHPLHCSRRAQNLFQDCIIVNPPSSVNSSLISPKMEPRQQPTDFKSSLYPVRSSDAEDPSQQAESRQKEPPSSCKCRIPFPQEEPASLPPAGWRGYCAQSRSTEGPQGGAGRVGVGAADGLAPRRPLTPSGAIWRSELAVLPNTGMHAPGCT